MKYLIQCLLTGMIIISCTGNPEEKSTGNMVAEEPDGMLMFDGKTLDGWEITNFGPQGQVYVSNSSVILSMGEGCTGITWKGEFPETNYRLTLEAKRISGNDFFCGITFPVMKEYCSLIIGGWGGTTTGLSCIDQKDASENETTVLMKYEKDHWYNICLVVNEDTIKAFIDNEVIVDFRKDDKKLSLRPEVELLKPFGIASWNTTAALRNIRLEKTDI